MFRLRSSSRYVCFVALLSAFAGCASDPAGQTANNQKPTQSDPSKGIICTYEVPTGSTLREKKCTTPEQRIDQARDAEHQILVTPAAR